MRRFISHIFILAFALFAVGFVTAGAQEPSGGLPSDDAVLRLTADLGRSHVSFDYSYVMKGSNVSLRGGGSLTVQGSCYFIEGDGLQIWSDGSSVWTIDDMEGEVVIESADSVGGFAANPLLTIAHCGELYVWDADGRVASFGGVACREFSLTPKAKVEFTDVRLYIADDKLVGAVMGVAKNTISFTITSYKSSPADPSVVFVPETFPEDSIITDLR